MQQHSDSAQGAPIYLQIYRNARQMIASGAWPPGMRMPPVRELSLQFGVNPNTAQRALAELERAGLICTDHTAEPSVTRDAELIRSIRAQLAAEYAEGYRSQMQALGCDLQEMHDYLDRSAGRLEGGAGRPQERG